MANTRHDMPICPRLKAAGAADREQAQESEADKVRSDADKVVTDLVDKYLRGPGHISFIFFC